MAELTLEDVERLMQGFVAKHGGDWQKAAAQLFDDNHKYREKIRDLEATVSEFTAAKGKNLVISEEDLKLFTDLRALGKPEDLKAAVSERDTLKTELTESRKVDSLRKAAEVTGFRDSVLKQLAKDLEIETREVEVQIDGKTEKVTQAFVKEGTKSIPLTDYADTNWKDFMSSLKVEGSETSEAPRQPWVPQGGDTRETGKGGGKSTLLDDFIKSSNEQSAALASQNPLVPTPAAPAAK